jgi:proteasome accessory factor B
MLDPSSFLNSQEVAALAATSRILAQYQGTPYYEEVSRAIDKLMQYMPIACSGDGLFDVYSFDNSVPLSGADQDHFALTEQAVRDSRKIVMTYKSSSRQAVTERIVHPYRLHYDQGGGTWYLIGFCEYRNEVRTFAICRIQHLSLTGDHFAIPASFSIDRYLRQAFNLTSGGAVYDVVIRFTPYQAQWIREHRWHPTQKIREYDDGSLTITLNVSALDAVKRWVMRYGAQAEVLEPQELRDMMKGEVRKMVKLYKQSTR